MKYERILWVDDNPADWFGSLLWAFHAEPALVERFDWRKLEKRVTFAYNPKMAASLLNQEYDLVVLDADMPPEHSLESVTKLNEIIGDLGKKVLSMDLKDRKLVFSYIVELHHLFVKILDENPIEGNAFFDFYLRNLVGRGEKAVIFSNSHDSAAMGACIFGIPFYFKKPKNAMRYGGYREEVERAFRFPRTTYNTAGEMLAKVLRIFPQFTFGKDEPVFGEFKEERPRGPIPSAEAEAIYTERERNLMRLRKTIPFENWIYGDCADFVRDVVLA